MTRAMTPAEAALQSAQTRQPPLYPKNSRGRDRVQALAGLLEWPDALQQRRDDGRIALGEIGDWQPDARTYGVDEQNYVIEVTSGYMDFLYALGRAMAGASVVYGRDGSVKNAQGLSVSNVADLAAQTLKEWQKHCQPRLWDLFWKEKRIEHARFDLSAPARDITETLVTCAELFTIAHEIGHVALGLGFSAPAHANSQVAADLAGLAVYVPTAAKLIGERFAFAGPALAVRVTGSLSRCGVTFSGAYPPVAERLDHLLRGLRAFCPSDQYFTEASTIMVANLSFMDDIDKLIQPHAPSPVPNAWEGLVGAIAALQALVTERRPPAVFFANVHSRHSWSNAGNGSRYREDAIAVLPAGGDRGQFFP